MLTPRENLLTMLRHERPEWTPVFGHVDNYSQPNRRGMDPELEERLFCTEGPDQRTVEFSRNLGLDIADLYPVPLVATSPRVRMEEHREKEVLTSVWHTPAGDLQEVKRYSPGTGLWYTQEHLVKTKRDLPALAALHEDQEFALSPDLLELTRARRQLIGEEGLLLLGLPGTPLGQMVRVYAGAESLAYLWADARAELRATLEVMGENYERWCRLAAQVEEAEALITMDDTSTTTQSPAMFEEFCLGYTDRMADICHAAGKFYLHHSCGLIRDLLPLYAQTRMDAVHAFTIPPVGDVAIAEGKAVLGSRIALLPIVVQLMGDMSDREKVMQGLEEMYAEAGEENVGFWFIADPEKDMEDHAWLAGECLRLARKPQREIRT
ncbi:MAG: hypothetical protein GX100_09150 [candidate division WS1 bacterium]|nr:hypothetical protein [candidate division WS1 bacterium]